VEPLYSLGNHNIGECNTVPVHHEPSSLIEEVNLLQLSVSTLTSPVHGLVYLYKEAMKIHLGPSLLHPKSLSSHSFGPRMKEKFHVYTKKYINL
jgi:hypothetical protein